MLTAAARSSKSMVNTTQVAEVLRETQDFELAQRYRSLSGHERVGFAKEHLTQAKTLWPSYLQDQMLTKALMKFNCLMAALFK